jgi:hypothetical protein
MSHDPDGKMHVCERCRTNTELFLNRAVDEYWCDNCLQNAPAEETQATEPLIYIIPAAESDLHRLDIQRTGGLLYITTNNRKMYEKWGTLAWDEPMARQLIDGLQAVLAGAGRAVTQSQLDLEQNAKMLADAARERNRGASAPAINYDNLFES